VRCLFGHGARGTRQVVLTSSELAGSLSEMFSVDMSGLSVMLRGNHAGTGSAFVTVHGASLGLVAFTAMARLGQTGCGGTEWESETSVRCLVGHGAQGTRRVTVTAGERGGSMSEVFSMDMSGLSMMRRGNHAGTGSTSVTVHGASLGLVALTTLGRIGHTGCEGTEWESRRRCGAW